MPVLRRRETLSAQLAASLTDSIRRGELPPGQRLPSETEMIGQYGVSRTVVREAIASLRASGLVETRQGVGAFVLEPVTPDPYRIDERGLDVAQDAIDMLELRIGLETEAASLAALRRKPHHLAVMNEATQRMQAAIEQGEDAVPADLDFHLAVAEASGNRHFPALFGQLGARMIPRSRLAAYADEPEQRILYLRRANREHRDVLRAIEWSDPEAARSAMRLHLSGSRERLRAAMAASNPPSPSALRSTDDTDAARPLEENPP